jgi:hypothetical protein
MYFDHILVLDELEEHIHAVAETPEEKEELWQLVDELVQNEIMGCVLDNLPKEHHDEFLEKFHEAPHSHELIIYINERIDGDIEVILKDKVQTLNTEIVEEISKR